MKKVAIIGAGISGLFIANLFKKNLNYQITVYEKNSSIDLDGGYGIQLSVNSVKLLNKIGFDKFQNEKIIFKGTIGRIRDIEIQESTGKIFLLTDSGSIWRLQK